MSETSSVTDSVTNMSSSITGTNHTNSACVPVILTNAAPVPLSTTESYTRIEDLLLKPGTERTIQVSYRPQKDVSINDFNAGQLIRKNFRILLEYGTFRTEEAKEKKVIQCKARTCTSFVEAIPKIINFGDTDVGTLKSLPINIFNRSDILARVELQFSSKVLNCLRGEITIQPRSYVELKLDLYPRKVNPDYRKQITLVNFLNKDNDQIIEVHSNNIDKNSRWLKAFSKRAKEAPDRYIRLSPEFSQSTVPRTDDRSYLKKDVSSIIPPLQGEVDRVFRQLISSSFYFERKSTSWTSRSTVRSTKACPTSFTTAAQASFTMSPSLPSVC